MVPLLVIPARNSNGATLLLVNEPVAEIVTSPVKSFNPPLDSTFIDPSTTVAPVLVKVEVFESVKIAPVETFTLLKVIVPKWLIVCVAEKVQVPVPEIVTGPVATVVIPPANVKGELLAEDKEVPAAVVNRPLKVLLPASLLSVIVAVPDKVIAPEVKFDVFKFKLPLWVTSPVRPTDPVVLQSSVPVRVVAPETESVLAPVKSKVDPKPIINVVAERGVLIVTLLEMVGAPIVTGLEPEMDCAFVVNETAPVPVRLKVVPL